MRIIQCRAKIIIELCIANDPRPTNGRPESSQKSWNNQIIIQANINNITVGGAVTVVTPIDTYLMVLERLENVIKQVKHTGPNRIFFHNGTNTAPVESHNMNSPETEINI